MGALANRIRIIGGQWKRTPIPVADRPGLRPSSDRVRETLFNWLGQDLAGQHVLDLFSGTGALGFEAASRGAASVTVVDNDRVALAGLHALRTKLNAQMIQIQAGDALAALARHANAPRRFDLVLLDPPFRQDWLPKLLPALAAVLAPYAALYVESEYAVSADQAQLLLNGASNHTDTVICVTGAKTGKAGQVYYQLFSVASSRR
jgi:16S rRNA (guanine966-N2)-methyltransferase